MENKCIFCGPVRNCAPYLQKVLANIEQLATLFDDYRILIFYDKSKDNTLQILKDYQAQNPDKMQFYVQQRLVSQFRTHRLAYARNFCLQQIRHQYPTYEYFIMMDFDDPNAKSCHPEILQKYLTEPNTNWDALSFNTAPKYYDIWALSIYPYAFSYNHFENNEKFYYTIQDYVIKRLQKLKPNQLLPCISAFNGFAIYRTNKFQNCHYDGRPNLRLIPRHYLNAHKKAANSDIVFKDYGHVKGLVEDCEHRAFHVQGINKNGARIRIARDVVFHNRQE